jgi:hypothetical protein
MTPIIVDPPPSTFVPESFSVGGIQLNDNVNRRLESLVITPPRKKPVWVTGGDSDGAELADEAHYESRVITGRVRVLPQATKDASLAALGAVTDVFQEAERGDVEAVWTPAGGTKSATIEVLMAEVDSIPLSWSGEDAGWWTDLPSPVMDFTLTCRPFMRGTPVTPASVSSSLPVLTMEVANVAGDVAADATLIVTDGATQSRRHVRWGREARDYNAATSLLLDSTSLTTTGYAGATGTRSGAYSGATNNVITSTLQLQAQALCSTGTQLHIGTFRVFARAYCSALTCAARLSWQAGSGPLRSNAYAQPVVVGWNDIDLGLVTIAVPSMGSQKWEGTIEAYSTAAGGETLEVDMLELMPAGEGYGVARATYAYRPGVTVGRDEFDGMTAGTLLGGRVASAGGTWATSAGSTDFAADAGIPSLMSRTATDYRMAVLGATTYTGTTVGVDVNASTVATNSVHDAYARVVDVNNWVACRMYNGRLEIGKYVAGTYTILRFATITRTSGIWYKLRLTVTADGTATGELLNSAGAVLTTVAATDTALATGGTLASGKPGFGDSGNFLAGSTRYYNDFYVGTHPTTETVGIALHSGRSLRIGSSSAKRYDSTGVYLGDPPSYVGARFSLAPAGGVGRKNRVAVMARRNDIETAADDYIADSLTAQVSYTPLYINAPR